MLMSTEAIFNAFADFLYCHGEVIRRGYLYIAQPL